jgi:hypothetical protein
VRGVIPPLPLCLHDVVLKQRDNVTFYYVMVTANKSSILGIKKLVNSSEGFEVFMAVNTGVVVFWAAAMCNVVVGYNFLNHLNST